MRLSASIPIALRGSFIHQVMHRTFVDLRSMNYILNHEYEGRLQVTRSCTVLSDTMLPLIQR